jgi:alpha-galactosidase
VDRTAWLAWQLDCPDKGEGMIQVFRRNESLYEMMRIKLRGLDPDATYALTNLDVPGATEASGRKLMDEGISLAIPTQPGALLIKYRKR